MIDLGRRVADCVEGTQEEMLTVIRPSASDTRLHRRYEYESPWTLN